MSQGIGYVLSSGLEWVGVESEVRRGREGRMLEKERVKGWLCKVNKVEGLEEVFVRVIEKEGCVCVCVSVIMGGVRE